LFAKILAVVVFAGLAGPADAQVDVASRPSVIANPDMLARELDRYENADKICWIRQEPVTVDWLAERDAGFRRGAYSRYHLSELPDGWRWVRRDAAYGPDLAAANLAVQGIPYTDLEVHAGTEADEGWALLTVDSELSTGQVRFAWTVPPQRVCMADGLHMTAQAEVVAGTPGARQVGFVLPLTAEQRLEEGETVKACSPSSTTGVDSEIGFLSDSGQCARELYHLDPVGEWSLWVNLPESFLVVYPYWPEGRKR
jgi:hypothetical protein